MVNIDLLAPSTREMYSKKSKTSDSWDWEAEYAKSREEVEKNLERMVEREYKEYEKAKKEFESALAEAKKTGKIVEKAGRLIVKDKKTFERLQRLQKEVIGEKAAVEQLSRRLKIRERERLERELERLPISKEKKEEILKAYEEGKKVMIFRGMLPQIHGGYALKQKLQQLEEKLGKKFIEKEEEAKKIATTTFVEGTLGSEDIVKAREIMELEKQRAIVRYPSPLERAVAKYEGTLRSLLNYNVIGLPPIKSQPTIEFAKGVAFGFATALPEFPRFVISFAKSPKVVVEELYEALKVHPYATLGELAGSMLVPIPVKGRTKVPKIEFFEKVPAKITGLEALRKELAWEKARREHIGKLREETKEFRESPAFERMKRELELERRLKEIENVRFEVRRYKKALEIAEKLEKEGFVADEWAKATLVPIERRTPLRIKEPKRYLRDLQKVPKEVVERRVRFTERAKWRLRSFVPMLISREGIEIQFSNIKDVSKEFTKFDVSNILDLDISAKEKLDLVISEIERGALQERVKNEIRESTEVGRALKTTKIHELMPKATASFGTPKRVKIKTKTQKMEKIGKKKKKKESYKELLDFEFDVTPLADWLAITYTQAKFGSIGRVKRPEAKKRYKKKMLEEAFALTFPTIEIEKAKIKTPLSRLIEEVKIL